MADDSLSSAGFPLSHYFSERKGCYGSKSDKKVKIKDGNEKTSLRFHRLWKLPQQQRRQTEKAARSFHPSFLWYHNPETEKIFIPNGNPA
jgi:hypothetical protein